MKNFKIEIPKGYEIDQEKSTFENIVFKEVAKKELPKSWEELGEIGGYYTDTLSDIYSIDSEAIVSKNKNVFATKEQAEASIALAQLSQLREVYRKGWEPNWSDVKQKYVIQFFNNRIDKENYCNANHLLSFQDEETRDLFLENFEELIEKAKPLLS